MTTGFKLIYSPQYDISFFGIENLHPFDSCKYSKTWDGLVEKFGYKFIREKTIQPQSLVTEYELLTTHTHDYLHQLKSSQYIAQALEIMPLAIVPNWIQKQFILNPMLLATKGTIIAAQEAFKNKIAVNLSGGYHHASQDEGEGFCIYSDIAVAISVLKKNNKVQEKVVIVDLDAHQGNGLQRIFSNDSDVLIYDMYNKDTYPQDVWAKQYIDYDVPLNSRTSDREYLNLLKKHLPLFLNQAGDISLAFYNAGTDIYESDKLGGLEVSAEGILERDKFVFETFIKADIPFVMVLSGGYTQESYKLIVNSLTWLIQNIEKIK